MAEIPDAPWIRHAETYGVDDPDPVYCPICGEECETVYADKDGTVFACNNCLTEQDAGDWWQEELERWKPE